MVGSPGVVAVDGEISVEVVLAVTDPGIAIASVQEVEAIERLVALTGKPSLRSSVHR